MPMSLWAGACFTVWSNRPHVASMPPLIRIACYWIALQWRQDAVGGARPFPALLLCSA